MQLTEAEIETIDAALFSPLARMIIRTIGKRAAVRLFEARGGTFYRVPIDGAKSAVLCELIGRDAAIRLCERFARRDIDIPKIDNALRQIRDARIRDESSDESLSTLALRYNLTTRQISNIVYGDPKGKPRGPAVDERQAKLFG